MENTVNEISSEYVASSQTRRRIVVSGLFFTWVIIIWLIYKGSPTNSLHESALAWAQSDLKSAAIHEEWVRVRFLYRPPILDTDPKVGKVLGKHLVAHAAVVRFYLYPPINQSYDSYGKFCRQRNYHLRWLW